MSMCTELPVAEDAVKVVMRCSVGFYSPYQCNTDQ